MALLDQVAEVAHLLQACHSNDTPPAQAGVQVKALAYELASKATRLRRQVRLAVTAAREHSANSLHSAHLGWDRVTQDITSQFFMTKLHSGLGPAIVGNDGALQ